MYAGKSESVPLPTIGHLHTLKNGYIYWEDGGKWDNERKQTIDARVSIGKIAPDHEFTHYHSSFRIRFITTKETI